MKTNVRSRNTLRTAEGAPAKRINKLAQLRRSVMSCLLFESEFYEDGIAIADRIRTLAAEVKASELASVANEARNQFYLRHVPLLLGVSLAARADEFKDSTVASTINNIVGRVDEITELVNLYWLYNPDKMIPRQMRKGLAMSFDRFDAYQFGKYDFDKGKAVKLRDVLRLVRPKPHNDEQSALFKAIKDNKVAAPDTWETALMRGKDKKETFTRLIEEGRLGYLALLRNLRNMEKSGVDADLVNNAILARKGARFVLPFRYTAAARAAPQFEPSLDKALVASVADMPKLPGKTIVLVDVSGSMDHKLSGKSDLTRIDAAATLASIINGDCRVFTFSNLIKEVPARRGMSGVDVIKNSQPHSGTLLGEAVHHVNREPHDRLICISDEQSHSPVPDPVAKHAYMINVASNEHGVGYGKWVHVDGFSESVLKFIPEIEAVGAD